MATRQRSPQEIRDSIERNREDLGRAIQRLQVEVREVTDWRKQVRAHQRELILAAAATGFVLGGGIGGVLGLFRRRK
jgi:C4-dicarboxylate-specific signal transduction histidine kinase